MNQQLIFKVAETEEEKAKAKEVIKRVFVDELKYNQMKSDKFDPIAIFLIAVQGKEVFAALRIIPDTPLGLPIEEFVDISCLRSPEIKLAEVSRLACLKSYRNLNVSSRGINFYEKTIQGMGLTHIIIESLLETVRLYRFLGFTPFGEPFYDFSVDLHNFAAPNSVGLMKCVKEVS